MVAFTGGAGTHNNGGVVYEWSDVIVVLENGAIVDYFTQFQGDALPDTGTAVTIGNFNVQLTSLSYKHLGDPVGASDLVLQAGARFLQAADGFTIGGELTNNGAMTVTAMTTVTGAIENNHLLTVQNDFVKLAPVDGDFFISGSGDLRLRGGALTGFGGDSSVTDVFISSRISGHGRIGAEFGWAGYPSDGGYIVIHNSAAGRIEANVSGQTLTVNTQLTAANPVDNAGLFAASGGGTLLFDGYQGSIDGSPLFVAQTSAGKLKAFDGSTVVLDDTVVTGGTLDGQGSGVIRVEGFYTRLVNLDITASARVNMGRWAALEGSIENRGKMVADGFDSATSIDADDVTLSGGGSFQLVGNFGNSRILGEAPGAVLTNTDHTIFGKGTIAGGNLSVVNAGVISARPDAYSLVDGDGLSLDALAGLTNTGMIEARGAATLTLASIAGPVDNGGGTIRAIGVGSMVSLANVTIAGGVLHTDANGLIRADGGTVKLLGIETTKTTNLNVGRTTIFESATVNRGTIVADDFQARMLIDDADVLLTGGGTVILKNDTTALVGEAPGAVLTNVSNTIRGEGFIGGANLGLVNAGLIHANADADPAVDVLVIDDLASFANSGRLEARNGATLVLGNTVDGQIDNKGGTIRAAGSGSLVDLADSVIRGGKIETVSGGSITLGRVTWDGRLSTVTSNADMDLVNARHLTLKGAIANSGDVSFTYRSGLIIGEDTTLSGGGSFTIHEGFEESAFTAAAPGKILRNVDNTFAGGAGSFGRGSGLVFVNGAAGVLTANQVGKTLRVETGNTIVNNGVLLANGGTLDVFDRVDGTGRIEITNGGTVIVDQGTDQRVSFVGASADTLSLSRREPASGGFDFTIANMGVGDRIRLDVGAGAGQEAAFTLAYTANGVTLRTDAFTNGSQAYALGLLGTYSEGHFRLVGGADGALGYERVQTRDGNASDNTLVANDTGERLIGLDGNDVLLSGAGDDVLDGSRGTDTADFRRASSAVTVSLDNVAAQPIGGGLGTDRLLSIENVSGSSFGDTLHGNALGNVIDGKAGADTMEGLAGDDTYYVDRAGDAIIEAVGQGVMDRVIAHVSYVLGAGASVERLDVANPAATTAQNLTGNEFAQQLWGGAGNNILDGGAGSDTLHGLAGNDVFRFSTALGATNIDTIADFDVPQDTIQLENAVFAGLAAGVLAAGAFNTGTAATQSDDRIIYNAANGALFFDADGAGGTAQVRFATMTAGLALTNADFFVT